jgi:hypothetical protein
MRYTAKVANFVGKYTLLSAINKKEQIILLMYRRIRYILLFLLVSGAAHLSAQFPSNMPTDSIRRDTLPPVDSSDLAALDSLADVRNQPLADTTRVAYAYLDAVHQLLRMDTSLQDFEQVRTIWAREEYLRHSVNLGSLGTPLLALRYQPKRRTGFYVGLDAAAPYRLSLDRLPFYEIERRTPYTDLYYSQINQRNTTLRATFAHQASPKLYYLLHYGLTNAFGFFDNQGVRNQNLALALRYRAGRSETYAAFLSNSHKGQENGGVSDMEDADSTSTTLLSSVGVRLSAAETNQAHSDIHWGQNWYNRPFELTDSSTTSSANLAIGYSLDWSDNRYKHFDTAPDNNYYFDFQTNARGIRRYIAHQRGEAALRLRYAPKGSLIGSLYQRVRSPLILEANAFYRLHRLVQEPIAVRNIQQFGAGGTLFFNFAASDEATNFVRGRGDAQFVFTGSALDFYIDGKAEIGLGKWLRLDAAAFYQRAEGSETARRLYLSGVSVWDNSANLRQQQDISFSADLSVPRIGFSIGAANHTITNMIYSDTNRIIQQANNQPVNIIELRTAQNLRWRGWGCTGEAAFQSVALGADIMRLPTWQLRYSLFWEGKVFKGMQLRTGASIRYWSAFGANGYFPLTQQFYVQNGGKTEIYPIIDYFLSARIYQARVFVNAENILQIITKQNYFSASHYPSANFLVRLGVSWRLFN